MRQPTDHRFWLFIYFASTRYSLYFHFEKGNEKNKYKFPGPEVGRMEYSDVCPLSFLFLLIGWDLLMLRAATGRLLHHIWSRDYLPGARIKTFFFPRPTFLCVKEIGSWGERASCFCVIHEVERKDQKVPLRIYIWLWTFWRRPFTL